MRTLELPPGAWACIQINTANSLSLAINIDSTAWSASNLISDWPLKLFQAPLSVVLLDFPGLRRGICRISMHTACSRALAI